LCRERGIWLFSDEVYRLIERDPALRLPQAIDLYERAISMNVMSKAYGMPGLRIGWLACKNRELLVRFERYKHYLSICNSAPSEVLARIALQARDQILERNRAIVRSNITEWNTFFAEFPQLFDWKVPDGGCVGFIRYKGADGVEAFTQRLVEESGVLFLPSSIYYSELNPVPTNYMRVGYGRSHVPEGIVTRLDTAKSPLRSRIIPQQPFGSPAEQRHQFGRFRNPAGIAIAQQDLACLPQIGDGGDHGGAAIRMIMDLRVGEVCSDITPSCDDRHQMIAQSVGAWRQASVR
jgi:hypothetical protein